MKRMQNMCTIRNPSTEIVEGVGVTWQSVIYNLSFAQPRPSSPSYRNHILQKFSPPIPLVASMLSTPLLHHPLAHREAYGLSGIMFTTSR